MVETLRGLLSAANWQVIHSETRQPREQQLTTVDDIQMSPATRKFFSQFRDGVYCHQHAAFHAFMRGQDVAMTTGTASGKSAVFYSAAIQLLSRDPRTRILAVYPMKALGREQESRWKAALDAADLGHVGVARVDGDVETESRLRLLRECSVLVVTPDILHAWLLPNIGEHAVWNFVSHLRLVVVDEVHVYTGVFGSNSSFLFRRLEHVMALGGKKATYIAASATVRDPVSHLRALFGREFEIIDESQDTSMRHALDVLMVQPTPGRDLLTSLSDLLRDVVTKTQARFIVFVDSRKQTELITSILARGTKDASETDDDIDETLDYLRGLDVLPYRAGFEERDRDIIQRQLSAGRLRGVVSTSALELGIDIAHLELGILVGVPRSRTSLQQRIGRVGRKTPGAVIIINAGDLFGEAMFTSPGEILRRPLAESALYLENLRIQYIHAMCLARAGGEHDQACVSAGLDPDTSIIGHATWPEGFVSLCNAERSGQVESDLQSMKVDAGDTPHWTYPLRDVESQFRVELKLARDLARLGSLSHSQVMREAYPGAIYYYMTRPFRVGRVNLQSKTIRVRPEKRYTTTPGMIPAIAFPNLSEGSIFRAVHCGDSILLETAMQVRESVTGYKERRGPNQIKIDYPITGVFAGKSFTRNYFTTGVFLFAECLQAPGVSIEPLSALLYECFLMEVPFERHDLNYASGRLKVRGGPLQDGARFIAIYDQTYGSLRLSGRLVDPATISRLLVRARELAELHQVMALNEQTEACLAELTARVAGHPLVDCSHLFGSEVATTVPPMMGQRRLIPVIAVGSSGIYTLAGNQEFFVEAIFYAPDGVKYRGRLATDTRSDVVRIVSSNTVVSIPGETKSALFNPDTGEVLPAENA